MKTPKREYKKYYICPATGEPDEWTLGNIDARWKRKNRVKQLKNTIFRLTQEKEELNTARVLLRNYLVGKRNACILRARRAEIEEGKRLWLNETRECNLFLALTMSSEELEAEMRGEDVLPHALKFTEEEKAILIEGNKSHADGDVDKTE